MHVIVPSVFLHERLVAAIKSRGDFHLVFCGVREQRAVDVCTVVALYGDVAIHNLWCICVVACPGNIDSSLSVAYKDVVGSKPALCRSSSDRESLCFGYKGSWSVDIFSFSRFIN